MLSWIGRWSTKPVRRKSLVGSNPSGGSILKGKAMNDYGYNPYVDKNIYDVNVVYKDNTSASFTGCSYVKTTEKFLKFSKDGVYHNFILKNIYSFSYKIVGDGSR